MKKLLAILVCFALVGFCSSATAATVLSDEELGELYAGEGIIPYISKPVAEQTNTGIVYADGYSDGDIEGVSINQKNQAALLGLSLSKAYAFGIGPQNNYAVIVTEDGAIHGVSIKQKNQALLLGAVLAPMATGIREQRNIAVLLAKNPFKSCCSDDGDVTGVSIKQKNQAGILGLVGSCSISKGVRKQSNIAAVLAADDIRRVRIKQKNEAGALAFTLAPCMTREIGPQSNIAIVAAKGDISCTGIKQTNRALSVTPLCMIR